MHKPLACSCLHAYTTKTHRDTDAANSERTAQITRGRMCLENDSRLSNLLTFAQGEDGASGRVRDAETKCTDHDACEQAHAFSTVGVRNHVSVADGEESDRDEPHGAQEVTGHILSIMVPTKNPANPVQRK